MEMQKEKSDVSGVDELRNLVNHFVPEGDVKQKIDDAGEQFSDQIRQRPLVAFGLAAAVGFVIGTLLKR